MNSRAADELNIPGRVLGWAPEGGARVEILSRCGDHDIGSVLVVSLRPNPRGRVFDFAFFMKNGLRTGGIVLLRRLRIESETTASIRSLDVLLARDSFGPVFVVQNAAVSILPPPPNSLIVERTVVAMTDESITIKSIKDGISRIRPGLEQASTFGRPGLVLTGEDEEGEIVEMVVGGEDDLSIDDVLYALEHHVDAEIAALVRKGRPKWRLVPFFLGDVDPDLSSKISAQRANLDYGDGDIFSWTRSNCVLRAFGDRWLIADTSIIQDGVDREAVPLLDVVDG